MRGTKETLQDHSRQADFAASSGIQQSESYKVEPIVALLKSICIKSFAVCIESQAVEHTTLLYCQNLLSC